MAEKGLDMLQKDPVGLAQFATLNQKYPSDVAYHIRNILKVDIETVRTSAGSLYMVPEHYKTYQAGLKKDKQETASETEAKEEIRTAAQSHIAAGAVAAAA